MIRSQQRSNNDECWFRLFKGWLAYDHNNIHQELSADIVRDVMRVVQNSQDQCCMTETPDWRQKGMLLL